jgi:hypothetical protein
VNLDLFSGSDAGEAKNPAAFDLANFKASKLNTLFC